MSDRPEKNPEAIPAESLGSLSSCLVEGDAEQRQREKHVRRRALAISIAVQSAVLTVLVLIPLFAKTERIVMKNYVPIPPYGHPNHAVRGNNRPASGQAATTERRFEFRSPTRPLNPIRHGEEPLASPSGFDSNGNQLPEGPGCTGCIDIGINPTGPRPPAPSDHGPRKPQIVRQTNLDPAMLIYRVDPIYPPLAKQLHKEGRVELRAIIGTDGSIRSLQVVSGDALFLMSAREAVQQWRYRPTILNGQPVEIDTSITVVYTLQH
jgi:periplasmic protein TonB